MGTPGLAAFVARRVLLSIPVLILASVVTFGLVAASGDPLAEARADPHVHRRSIELRERRLNLDRPLPVRYAIWAGGLLRGDFGRTVEGQDVGGRLWRAAGATGRLVVPAMAMAVAVAVAVGSVSAARYRSWIDHAGTVVTFVLLSLPAFWLGWLLRDLALHVYRALDIRVLSFVGERSTEPAGSTLGAVGDRLRHLVLPATTLALVATASWTRFLRASMLESLAADHVRTARAKGLPEWRVGRDALRTSLVPMTAVVAVSFAGFLGGAVIVERIFSWPGLGQVLLQGLQDHDVNLVSGWLLLASVGVVGVNLVADVLSAVLDPRTRRA